jgi:hypothetical protein
VPGPHCKVTKEEESATIVSLLCAPCIVKKHTALVPVASAGPDGYETVHETEHQSNRHNKHKAIEKAF